MRQPLPHLLLFISALTLLHTSCEKVPQATTHHAKDSLLVYVMAGQSNMAGRGTMEPQDTVSNPRILMIDSTGRLVIAREPLHFYYPPFSGLDCGMSFATHLLPHIPADCKICLVPCAIGNTSLQQWLYDSSASFRLYSNMIGRTRTAMKYGQLSGVLWHQGESNAETPALSASYAGDLAAFVKKIRTDVGDDHLPFFAATLADFCNRPYKTVVNDAIRKTAVTGHDMYVVSTDNLSGKPDSIHFDAAGQREMGRRFAEAARLAIK